MRLSHVRRITAAAAGLVLLAASGCGLLGPKSEGGRQVLIWTQQAGVIEMRAQQEIVRRISARHPELTIKLVRKPGGSAGDNSKLIAAVRGEVAPDIMLTGRFDMAQQAAIGLLRPVDPRLRTDRRAGGADLRKAYLPFSLTEATYRGQLYALPFDTDARGLIYNKSVLRDAGVDLDLFDPANGPMTIDQMMAAAKRIDRVDRDGHYLRLGIIPWDGEGSPTTWAMARGAKFFSERSCRIDTRDPALVGTYKQLAAWGKRLDYSEVDLFKATYQPPNAPPAQSPFNTGRLGMAVTGNWEAASIREYAPKLDWGVTYLPVAKPGGRPFTWSGGYGLAMPKGSRNPGDAWTVMKEFAGREGQRIFSIGTSHLPTYQSLLKEKRVVRGQEFFAKMLDHSRVRQPLPVASTLWDALSSARDAVLLGDRRPAQALAEASDRVNPGMAQYCPFRLPPGS